MPDNNMKPLPAPQQAGPAIPGQAQQAQQSTPQPDLISVSKEARSGALEVTNAFQSMLTALSTGSVAKASLKLIALRRPMRAAARAMNDIIEEFTRPAVTAQEHSGRDVPNKGVAEAFGALVDVIAGPNMNRAVRRILVLKPFYRKATIGLSEIMGYMTAGISGLAVTSREVEFDTPEGKRTERVDTDFAKGAEAAKGMVAAYDALSGMVGTLARRMLVVKAVSPLIRMGTRTLHGHLDGWALWARDFTEHYVKELGGDKVFKAPKSIMDGMAKMTEQLEGLLKSQIKIRALKALGFVTASGKAGGPVMDAVRMFGGTAAEAEAVWEGQMRSGDALRSIGGAFGSWTDALEYVPQAAEGSKEVSRSGKDIRMATGELNEIFADWSRLMKVDGGVKGELPVHTVEGEEMPDLMRMEVDENAAPGTTGGVMLAAKESAVALRSLAGVSAITPAALLASKIGMKLIRKNIVDTADTLTVSLPMLLHTLKTMKTIVSLRKIAPLVVTAMKPIRAAIGSVLDLWAWIRNKYAGKDLSAPGRKGKSPVATVLATLGSLTALTWTFRDFIKSTKDISWETMLKGVAMLGTIVLSARAVMFVVSSKAVSGIRAVAGAAAFAIVCGSLSLAAGSLAAAAAVVASVPLPAYLALTAVIGSATLAAAGLGMLMVAGGAPVLLGAIAGAAGLYLFAKALGGTVEEIAGAARAAEQLPADPEAAISRVMRAAGAIVRGVNDAAGGGGIFSGIKNMLKGGVSMVAINSSLEAFNGVIRAMEPLKGDVSWAAGAGEKAEAIMAAYSTVMHDLADRFPKGWDGKEGLDPDVLDLIEDSVSPVEAVLGLFRRVSTGELLPGGDPDAGQAAGAVRGILAGYSAMLSDIASDPVISELGTHSVPFMDSPIEDIMESIDDSIAPVTGVLDLYDRILGGKMKGLETGADNHAAVRGKVDGIMNGYASVLESVMNNPAMQDLTGGIFGSDGEDVLELIDDSIEPVKKVADLMSDPVLSRLPGGDKVFNNLKGTMGAYGDVLAGMNKWKKPDIKFIEAAASAVTDTVSSIGKLDGSKADKFMGLMTAMTDFSKSVSGDIEGLCEVLSEELVPALADIGKPAKEAQQAMVAQNMPQGQQPGPAGDTTRLAEAIAALRDEVASLKTSTLTVRQSINDTFRVETT